MSRYADSVSDILLRQGEAKARAQLQSGQAWSQGVQQLGQIPGDLIKQRQVQQELDQRAAVNAQQIRTARSEEEKRLADIRTAEARAKQDTAIADLFSREGVIPKPSEIMKAAGAERGIPIVNGLAAFQRLTRQDFEDAQQSIQSVVQGMNALPEPLRAQAFPGVRQGLVNAGVVRAEQIPDTYDPVWWTQMLNYGKEKKEPALITTRGPDGQPVRSPDVAGATPYQAPALTTGIGPTGRPVRVPDVPGQAVYVPPKDATTRYQSRDVMNDAGQTVPALFDSTTGAYLDPATRQPIKTPRSAPSAQEAMDARKFKKAAPVLGAVSELSEKINTGKGLLAKATGAAAKVAAQANYNDDVAEYQSLISGFTPLVARALGHTGVLTQQDVDSVKELFPKPGDSKTLRDRKVQRLMGIVGQLEDTERNLPTPIEPPPVVGTGGLTYQDYLKARGAP